MDTYYTRMKKMFKKKKKVVPKQEPPKEEPKPRLQKIYAYKLVLNCDQESGKKYTNESTNCESCKAQHDRNRGTHKPEPYTKPSFKPDVCRDRQCKTHYNKPLFKPSSASNASFPPLLPSPLFATPPMLMPAYHQQQRQMMYSLPPPRQSYPYHDYGMQHAYPQLGSYSNRW